MSSCKFWRERQLGHHCDKTCRETSRSVTPALLRLDSTGQVSSVESPSVKTTKMCQGKKGNCFSCKRPQQLSLQSVIDTANSYLSSASSYIESIYPHKPTKCLVDSRPSEGNRMDFGYMFQKGFNMSAVSNSSKQATWPDVASTSYPEEECQVPQGLKKAWTQEILGALQSTVFNKDMHTYSHKPEIYIPPPVRNRQLQEKQCNTLFIDPKLKPYNAKLLKRSQCKDTDITKNSPHCQRFAKVSRDSNPSSDKTSERKVAQKDDRSRTTTSLPLVSENQTQRITDISPNEKTEIPQENHTETEMKSDISVQDWFEYENQSEIIIPLEVDDQLLESVSKEVKTAPNEIISVMADSLDDNQDRMLHSWYSMDNDTEIKKSNSTLNIPMPACSSQKSCDSFEHSSYSLADSVSSHDELNCNTKSTNHASQETKADCSSDLDSTKTNNSQKKQQEDIDKKKELFSVLYIRNGNGPKRRPSAQKRSKHRAQKSINSLKNHCNKTTKSLKEGNAIHPNSSVAFILGLDHDKSDHCFSMQSFQVSCDIDDFDWSSCDENDSEFEDIDCSDFDLFSPLKSLVNFQVTCSVPSSTTTSFNHDVLERVNLEWGINFAVQTDCQKKSTTPKKVLFKEDKHLATVHPMIAWSYAYQAARKGPWEEIARDRGRFKRRITDGEKLLKPVLEIGHRDRIFKERFDLSVESQL